MSILDLDKEDVKITKDDLIKDGWSPDRLGRVWIKRPRIHRCENGNEFDYYIYLRYTLKNPHTKEKYKLFASGTMYEHTFTNIKTFFNLNATIHKIAHDIVGDKPYEIKPANYSRFKDWKSYIESKN